MSKADKLLAMIGARKQQNSLYNSGMSEQFNIEEERINVEGSKVINTEYISRPDFSELSHQYNIGSNPDYANCVVSCDAILTDEEEDIIEGMRKSQYEHSIGVNNVNTGVQDSAVSGGGIKEAEDAMNLFRNNPCTKIESVTAIDWESISLETSETDCIEMYNRIRELILSNTNVDSINPILQGLLSEDDVEMGDLRDCPNFRIGKNKVILNGNCIKPEGMYISIVNTSNNSSSSCCYYFTVYSMTISDNDTNHIVLLNNSEYSISNDILSNSNIDSLTIIIDSCVVDTHSDGISIIYESDTNTTVIDTYNVN